jgi:hypothetical protein
VANSPLHVIDPDGRDNMYGYGAGAGQNAPVNMGFSMPVGGGAAESYPLGSDPLAYIGGYVALNQTPYPLLMDVGIMTDTSADPVDRWAAGLRLGGSALLSAAAKVQLGRIPCAAKTGLGDLTAAEVRAIQAAANETGESLTVVGSAARGTRRGVGSDWPIGKGAGTRSDIDYLINKPYPPFPSPLNDLDHVLPRLPDVNPAHGPIRGTFNPFEGPGIQFQPGKSPVFLPGN